ncbi:MAG: hypothetical protein AAFY60_03850, partial [Myxococcota bacterium]
LSLWHREVRVGMGAQLDDRGAFAPRPTLRFALGRPRWSLSAGLEFARTSFDNDGFLQEERWFGGDLRYSRLDLVDRMAFFAGASGRWLEQTVERPDADALSRAGLETTDDFAGFAGGAMLGANYRLPLGRRVTAVFEGQALGLLRQEGEELRIRPEIAVSVGISWGF